MTSRRPERLAAQIKAEMGIALRELRDPRIGFVTVTRVKLSADLRQAKIYISVLGSEQDKRESMRALARASGFLRRCLGQNLHVKRIPAIAFSIDESPELGDKVERLLESLRKGRED